MTYRQRLIFNVVLLIVLLAGMMLLSLRAARDVTIANSVMHLQHAAQQEQHNLRLQADALLREAGRIAVDPVLLAYLDEGVGSDGDGALLTAYLERLHGLTGDLYLLQSAQTGLWLGPQMPALFEAIARQPQADNPDAFFVNSSSGLLMAAPEKVKTGERRLANLVVARQLNRDWLQQRAGVGNNFLLLFESQQQVLSSSHAVLEGRDLDISNGVLNSDDQRFRLREVSLQGASSSLPRLWLGVSESRMLEQLRGYARWIYLFTVLGGVAVWLVGWLILRNFERPFSQLMQTTQELLEGRLPVVARSGCTGEMDQLVNRFADVLDSLRHEQKELKQVHKKLQHTAITDSLTKLYNRRYLQEVTPGLFAQVERDQRYLTAILLDLDHFKDINDQHGHLGGDAVLVHFSRQLKHNSRANDYLFRIGGEEFLILNVTENPEDSVALAEKVRELAAASSATYQGAEIPVTVSAGISCCYVASGRGSLSQLLRGADKALYEAKANGRNRVVLHSSCRTAAAAARKRASVTLLKGDRSSC